MKIVEQIPGQLILTKEEILTVRNIALRRQILTMQLQVLDQEDVAMAVAAGRRLGVDMAQYVVDVDNGEVSPKA